MHCKASNIYALPEKFQEPPPLVYKLRILNLLPLNGENFWSLPAIKKAEAMVKNYNGLTADIKFAVQDTLFCKSIEAEASCPEQISFTKNLARICVKDKNAGNRLIKRLRDAALLQENRLHSNLIEEIESMERPQMAKNIKSEDEKNSATESWKKLSCNSFYDVNVRHFNNPGSFFVVLASEQNKFRDTSEECEALENIIVGATCLVKKEKTFRGKIWKVYVESIKVFLVDHGEIVDCLPSDLYKAPAEAFSLCFQSVRCRLVGVRPKFKMSTWPSKQSEAVEKLLRETGSPLRMYVLKKNDAGKENSMLGMSSYDVILIDPKTGKHLDDVAVTRNYVDRQHYEKPKDLDDDPNCESDPEEGVERSDDILKRMLESMINELSETESADEQTELAKEENQPKPRSSTSEPRIQDFAHEALPIPSALSYLVKQPMIVWQQNEVKVRLSISATDCIDYGMKISDTTIEIAISYENNRQEKAIIDLYCGVVPKLCSHEKRGLNIVANLPKKETNVEWPRLTESKERSQFIRFSNENIEEVQNLPLKGIPAEEMEEICENDAFLQKDHLELSDDDVDFY